MKVFSKSKWQRYNVGLRQLGKPPQDMVILSWSANDRSILAQLEWGMIVDTFYSMLDNGQLEVVAE